MTSEGKELAIVSFRLLTLLLPPKNRRHLQLLLRCMAKMSRNEKLMLDVAMTTRAVVSFNFICSAFGIFLAKCDMQTEGFVCESNFLLLTFCDLRFRILPNQVIWQKC